MPRFRFGRRRRNFGRMVRRARPIVRAATGIVLAKRVLLNQLTIPDITAADFDNPLSIDLLRCIEAQDEEVESDGTNIADTPLYSRITGMRMNLFIKAGAATDIRWMMHKSPDNDITVTSLATDFHNSNDTQPQRELRKMTVAKGYFAIGSDRLLTRFPIFVSKKALARISPMRENDRLRLVVAKHGDGTTATLSGFGTIYVRANG